MTAMFVSLHLVQSNERYIPVLGSRSIVDFSSAYSSRRNVFSVSSFRTPKSIHVVNAFRAAIRSTFPTPAINSSMVQMSVVTVVRFSGMR